MTEVMADARIADELTYASRDFASWNLTPSQLVDLELLMNGAFSPLSGFLTRAQCEAVLATMRLPNGRLWPVPIVLEIDAALAQELGPGDPLALRDPEGVMLAVLHVEDLWRPASADGGAQSWCAGGRIDGVRLPVHYDHGAWRMTPEELRGEFDRRRWRRVVAYQTRETMHRAEREATLRAVREIDANLLIHAMIEPTPPGDTDQYARFRSLEAILPGCPEETVRLAVLPFAAPRWHSIGTSVLRAIVAKNYGCTHLLVKPGQEDDLQPYAREIGITLVPLREMRYVVELDKYVLETEVPCGVTTREMSALELEARLVNGSSLPEWFTSAEVAAELRRWHPPRERQGCTIFFTGLSGSGKSTIANVLRVSFLEAGDRPVTLFDGDLVRKHLSSDLGFSREHRAINIRRIGYVASEITKNGGIAICAPIAPYDQVRKEVRRMIAPLGGFVLVHVATPLAVCEQRDRKGLYAKARAGLVKEFTGISDPYEAPDDADVVIDTTHSTPAEAARQILLHLEREGFIGVRR